MRKLNFVLFLLGLLTLGAGAHGQSSGINLLNNPGFESGKARWSASGGSFTISTSNPYKGTNIASFDASGSGQTVKNTLVAVGAGLEARACAAGIWYKADSIAAGDYTLYAEDSTSTALTAALSILPTSGTWRFAYVAFICPSAATTIRLVVASAVSNPAAISLDEMSLGSMTNEVLVNDPVEIVAHAYFAATASCAWSTTSAVLADFPTDTDCPGISVDHSSAVATIDTADTDLPQIKFTNLPSGIYEVTAQFNPQISTNTLIGGLAISDGTNIRGEALLSINDNDNSPVTSLSGVFSHSGGAKTFKIQGGIASNSLTILNQDGQKQLTFTVTRYPSSSTGKITLETQGWFIDATITGGNPDLGVSNVTSPAEIADSALTMALASGSANAQIPCSSTNPPTGLTCSAGNEGLGVAFVPPYAGYYYAIATFANRGTGDSTDNLTNTFRLVNTAKNSQTILLEGGENLQNRFVYTATDQELTFPVKVSGIFYLSPGDTRVIRVMYSESTGGPMDSNIVLADASSGANGNRNFNIKVIPLTQNFPQAVAFPTIPGATDLANVEATKLGLKAYSHGTTYASGLAPTITIAGSCSCGTLSSVQIGDFIPYQMQSGGWRVKFNIEITVSSTSRSSILLDVAGMTLNASTAIGQAISGWTNGSAPAAYAALANNESSPAFGVQMSHNAATTSKYYFSGDVKLASKPTWAY